MSPFGKAYLAFTAAGDGGHDVRTAYYNQGQWALGSSPLDANPADDAGAGSGRPQVATAGDGIGIVAWGESGHIYTRRVLGTSPSIVDEQADPPSISGLERGLGRRSGGLHRRRLLVRGGRVRELVSLAGRARRHGCSSTACWPPATPAPAAATGWPRRGPRAPISRRSPFRSTGLGSSPPSTASPTTCSRCRWRTTTPSGGVGSSTAFPSRAIPTPYPRSPARSRR